MAAILIVGHDQPQADAIGTRCRNAGHVVVIARHSTDAMIHLCRTSFDFVMVDARMPGKEAHALIAALRRRSAQPQPEIVAVAPRADARQLHELLALGASRVLSDFCVPDAPADQPQAAEPMLSR